MTDPDRHGKMLAYIIIMSFGMCVTYAFLGLNGLLGISMYILFTGIAASSIAY